MTMVQPAMMNHDEYIFFLFISSSYSGREQFIFFVYTALGNSSNTTTTEQSRIGEDEFDSKKKNVHRCHDLGICNVNSHSCICS